MKPIDNLKEEHVLIGRMLTVLEGYVRDAQAGRGLSPAALREAIHFVRGYADQCHHGKEEKVLFPALSEKSEGIAQGPVRVLESEHEIGRTLVGQVEAAIPGIEAGEAQATQQAARALDEYTRMLRQHITKEEDVLFELAPMLLSQQEEETLAEEFEAVERQMGEDAHHRFEDLVAALERQAGVAPSPGGA